MILKKISRSQKKNFQQVWEEEKKCCLRILSEGYRAASYIWWADGGDPQGCLSWGAGDGVGDPEVGEIILVTSDSD